MRLQKAYADVDPQLGSVLTCISPSGRGLPRATEIARERTRTIVEIIVIRNWNSLFETRRVCIVKKRQKCKSQAFSSMHRWFIPACYQEPDQVRDVGKVAHDRFVSEFYSSAFVQPKYLCRAILE